jgi:hypothetical protein
MTPCGLYFPKVRNITDAGKQIFAARIRTFCIKTQRADATTGRTGTLLSHAFFLHYPL